jgi:lysophospholipase L1-like esterase
VNAITAHSRRGRSSVSAALLLGLATLSGCDGGTQPTPIPDPEAPAITCPAPVTVNSLNGEPLNVTFSTGSITGGKVPVTVACTPPSNSLFPIGDTTVTCTATDALQRRDSCSFKVSVIAPRRLSLTRFIAFGDSITLGQDGYELRTELLPRSYSFILTDASYPETLRRRLLATYTLQSDVIRVQNDGYGGEFAGSAEAMARFSSDVIGRDHQAVLLMEGSNDVWFAALDNDPSYEDRAIANLGAMIDKARLVGIRVYLATIAPMRPPNSSCVPRCRSAGYARVPAFNERLKQLAVSKNVTLVDVNAAFNGDLSLLAGDGLHPNAQGFERIADAFFDKLRTTIETALSRGLD